MKQMKLVAPVVTKKKKTPSLQVILDEEETAIVDKLRLALSPGEILSKSGVVRRLIRQAGHVQ